MADITICCIKWGTKYGPEYVNKLYAMVRRNVLCVPHDFVCFTEDPTGIDPEIRIAPLPCVHPAWWQKVGLFQERIPGVDTAKIFFIDLDMVIVSEIDAMLEYDSDFTIMRNWPPEMHGDDNSYMTAAFLLKVGAQPNAWRFFEPRVMREYPSDQEWITASAPGADLFPYDWTPSYKLRRLQDHIPPEAKIVAFHGLPRPHQCGGWVKEYWK